MISKQIQKLSHKIEAIKNYQHKQHDRFKQMSKSLQQYEEIVKKWMRSVEQQITDIEKQADQIVSLENLNQNTYTAMINNLHDELKNKYNMYNKASKQSSLRLMQIKNSIILEFKECCASKMSNNKENIKSYQSISQKLQFLIEKVRNRQLKSKDSYEQKKQLIQKNQRLLRQQIQKYIQDVEINQSTLSSRLEQFRLKNRSQVQKLKLKWTNKAKNYDKIIHMLVEKITRQ